jgi:hypothetical protein
MGLYVLRDNFRQGREPVLMGISYSSARALSFDCLAKNLASARFLGRDG